MVTHEQIQEELLRRGDIFADVCKMVVNRLGFGLTRCEPLRPPSEREHGFTFLLLRPHSEFERRFSLSRREIVCLVSTFPTIDARCIRDTRQVIAQAKGRLDPDFIIIVAADVSTEETIRRMTMEDPEVFAAFSFEQVREVVAGREDAWLALEKRHTSKDLYDVRSAIKKSKDFFGRRGLLSQVQAEIANNGTSIGLFGLRKVGKTSFLYQLLERIRKQPDVAVAHVDFQLIDAVEKTKNYLVWTLAQSLGDALSKKDRSLASSIVGNALAYREARQRYGDLAGPFVEDVRSILSAGGLSLVIALDEIDLMLNKSKVTGWEQEFVSTWRLLRGLSQQYPGRLAFFLTGTNPYIIERASIGKEDNPIFAWINKLYIGPLDKDESDQLLTRLGSSMRLDWRPEALALVWSLAGGHPLLTRICGSEVHKALCSRDRLTPVTEEIVRSAIPAIQRASAPVLTQILELFREYYEDEFVILESIASGRYRDAAEILAQFPEEFGHLLGYRLLREERGMPRVPIALMEEWLRQALNRTPNRELRDKGTAARAAPVVDGLEIGNQIGNSGGFSSVYEGRILETGQSVAVKVYNAGELSPVQREVEVLARVESEYVVRIHMATKTLDGRPCLVMERLAGETLDAFVSPARAMCEADTWSVAYCVLRALAALHPNEERVKELRERELKPEEFTELQRVRHGYIHRDIKPSNIILVPGRGAVVFDFNIASPSGECVHTLSQTPGYLPPGMMRGDAWLPVVDLYALGITLLEVASGVKFTIGKVEPEDLVAACAAKHPDRLKNFLARLVRREFSSANEALREVRKHAGLPQKEEGSVV